MEGFGQGQFDHITTPEAPKILLDVGIDDRQGARSQRANIADDSSCRIKGLELPGHRQRPNDELVRQVLERPADSLGIDDAGSRALPRAPGTYDRALDAPDLEPVAGLDVPEIAEQLRDRNMPGASTLPCLLYTSRCV